MNKENIKEILGDDNTINQKIHEFVLEKIDIAKKKRQARKAGRRMKVLARKSSTKLKKAKKARKSSMSKEDLEKASVRAAKKKYLDKRSGGNSEDLSFAKKAKLLDKFKKVKERLAKKQKPKVRKAHKEKAQAIRNKASEK